MDLSDLQYVYYMVSKLAVISMNTGRKRKSIAKPQPSLDEITGFSLWRRLIG